MKITLTIGQLRRLVKEAAFKDAPELPLDLAITDAVHQLMSKGKDWYVPVTVTKGRKFKGNGYIIGGRQKSNGGYSGSGVRPLQYYIVTQVWDPSRGCVDEFNGDLGDPGVEEWNVPDDEKFEDLVGYVKSLIKQCVRKCGDDYRHRMFYIRKVLGVSTEVAEELANASAELDDTVEVDEEWEYLQRIQRKRDPNRQEFLISFNDTKFDPLDTLYHRDMRVFAKSEREALAMVRDEHPEFKVTKITLV